MNYAHIFTASLFCSTLALPLFAQDQCPAITDDALRLACFDEAFTKAETPPAKADDIGKWYKTVDKSELTDETTVSLMLISDDTIKGRFKEAGPANLFIRCKENTTAAFFVFNDLFMSDIQGRGKVEYRIGSQPMASVSTDVSTDNTALGLWSGGRSIPFVKKLIGHEKLIIRATPHSESPVTATFDIRGIDNAIAQLRETCGW